MWVLIFDRQYNIISFILLIFLVSLIIYYISVKVEMLFFDYQIDSFQQFSYPNQP
jgi:hypothetical protein